MISVGEKIVVEAFGVSGQALEALRALPGVAAAEYKDEKLTVRSERGKSNLTRVAAFITEQGIGYGRIYSELPTLNDVFLEITGKALRD